MACTDGIIEAKAEKIFGIWVRKLLDSWMKLLHLWLAAGNEDILNALIIGLLFIDLSVTALI
jgi:hypothetical protein